MLALAVVWLAVAWLLQALANHQLQRTLHADAARAIAAEHAGRTPHHWPLHSRDELVAGRVFGGIDLRMSARGLQVRADADNAELGLKLAHPVDLHYYRILQLHSSAALHVLVRPTLDGAQCSSELLQPINGVIQADLMGLAWHCSGSTAAAPQRAAMLRLAPQLPAGESVALGNVQLDCAPEPHSAHCAPLPHVALSLQGRVEEVLQRRDMLRNLTRASIIMPGPGAQTLQAPSARPGKTALLVFILFQAAGMLLLWRLPPSGGRLRAASETMLACAGPLFVVIGGYYGARVSPGVIVVAALSLLMVARLGWQYRHALRNAWQLPSAASWLLPALTVLAALAFVFTAGPVAGFSWQPKPAEVAQYLAWAAIQQLWIGVLVAQRAGVALRSPLAGTLLAASIFALLHTPNAMLMQLSLVGGTIWFINWQRHGALLPGIVAHAACGLLLSHGLGPEWLRSAEVSARFFL